MLRILTLFFLLICIPIVYAVPAADEIVTVTVNLPGQDPQTAQYGFLQRWQYNDGTGWVTLEQSTPVHQGHTGFKSYLLQEPENRVRGYQYFVTVYQQNNPTFQIQLPPAIMDYLDSPHSSGVDLPPGFFFLESTSAVLTGQHDFTGYTGKSPIIFVASISTMEIRYDFSDSSWQLKTGYVFTNIRPISPQSVRPLQNLDFKEGIAYLVNSENIEAVYANEEFDSFVNRYIRVEDNTIVRLRINYIQSGPVHSVNYNSVNYAFVRGNWRYNLREGFGWVSLAQTNQVPLTHVGISSRLYQEHSTNFRTGVGYFLHLRSQQLAGHTFEIPLNLDNSEYLEEYRASQNIPSESPSPSSPGFIPPNEDGTYDFSEFGGQSPEIKIDPSQYGLSRRIRYNFVWQRWEQRTLWWGSVDSGSSVSSGLDRILRSLSSKDFVEGLDYLLEVRANPSAHNVRDVIIPANLVYWLEQQRRPQTPPPTPTTPPVASTPQVPARPQLENNDECGRNRDYLKLCYASDATNPRIPPNAQQAIRSFIQETENTPGLNGYWVFHVAPNIPRVNQLREDSIERIMRNNLRDSGLRHVLLYESQTLPGRLSSAIYIIPDTFTGTIPFFKPPSSLREEIERRWTLFSQGFSHAEITTLIERISDQKKIDVEIILSPSAEFLWSSNTESQMQELKEHLDNQVNTLRACTSYLLVDSQSVKLLQSTQYCTLRVERRELTATQPLEQTRQILSSAMRFTPEVTVRDLLLAAYRFAETGDLFPTGQYETQVIRALLKDSGRFNLTPLEDQKKRIVEIQFNILQGELEDATQLLKDLRLDGMSPQFMRLGLRTAVRLFDQPNICEEILTFIHNNQVPFSRNPSEQRQANLIIEACQIEEAREQIQAIHSARDGKSIIDHVFPSNVTIHPTLIITFVNDGLPVVRFRELADTVSREILTIPNMPNHRDRIAIYSTLSAAPIVQSRGLDVQPQINTRALSLIDRVSHSTMYIVLSEAEYRSLTFAGNGYVSYTGCRGLERCISLHALRSIAFAQFDLPEERNTVTAPANSRSTDFVLLFSIPQQARINTYFGVET